MKLSEILRGKKTKMKTSLYVFPKFFGLYIGYSLIIFLKNVAINKTYATKTVLFVRFSGVFLKCHNILLIVTDLKTSLKKMPPNPIFLVVRARASI